MKVLPQPAYGHVGGGPLFGGVVVFMVPILERVLQMKFGKNWERPSW